MKTVCPLVLILLLAACETGGPLVSTEPQALVVAEPQPEVAVAAAPLPPVPSGGAAALIEEEPGTATPMVLNTATPAPPPTARTVEEFDTTTPEARAAVSTPAPAPAASGGGRLGTTVASLGAAGEPGFWIKTPLVTEARAGRLFYAATGRNVQVQLIPSGGSSGSGSQVSLAAMRLLDAPLDGLPEIVVYTN